MQHRWVVVGLLAAIGAAIACSDVVPTDPGFHVSKKAGAYLLDSAEAVDSATTFMLAAGCAPISGDTPVGTIRVPVPPAGPQEFDCHAVSHDSIHHIVRTYMQWESQWIVGAQMEAQDYWDVEDVQVYYCSSGDQLLVNLAAGTSYVVVGPAGSIFDSGQSDGSYRWEDCPASGNYNVWAAIYFDESGGPASPQPPYDWDDPPATGGPGGGTPPPPPAAATVVVSGGTGEMKVGDESAGFTAVAYDEGGNPIPGATFEWGSSASGVLVRDADAGVHFDAAAPGSTTVVATYGSVSGTMSVVVLAPTCGSSDDPNMALLDAGEPPTAACTPSAEDLAEFGSRCSFTVPAPGPGSAAAQCLANWVAAKVGGHLACASASQAPECGAWLDKLLSFDTTTVHLTQAQWEAMTADTLGRELTEADTNFVDRGNSIRYPIRRVFNMESGSEPMPYKWSLGHVSVFYDVNGNPVTMFDKYNFNPDDGTSAFRTAVKAIIANAANNLSFNIHWP